MLAQGDYSLAEVLLLPERAHRRVEKARKILMPITITSNSEGIQRMLGSGPGPPPALPNHPAQSTAPIDGWKSLLFGLPFLFAGAFIECAAFGIVLVHGRHVPG